MRVTRFQEADINFVLISGKHEALFVLGFLNVSKSVVVGSCWIGLDRICLRIGHMASTDDLDRQVRHTKSTSGGLIGETIRKF